MAKKGTIGVTLTLDGEKEFKKALSDINDGLRVNASEVQLAAAQYLANGESMEALTAKSEALQKQIYSQTEKVEMLRAALLKSAAQYGESDEKTMGWQISLNKAEAELYKMTGALNKNDEAVKKSKAGTDSLADAVNKLASFAGIQIPPALQGMVDKLEGVNASGAALVGVLGGIVTGLAKVTIETSKVADNFLTLSSTTGMSTDTLQELSYASELVDVSTETISDAMTKLIRNMETAKKGNNDQADAFRKLHVSIKTTGGTLKDCNDVFYQVIDSLGKISNETQRDALSMQIFGRSARDLNPLIEAGSGRLRELGEEAHKVGYVIDNESLQKFGALDDAFQRLSKQGDALKYSFAEALLPVLTTFFETISKIPVPVLQTLITLASVVTTVILAVKAFKSMSDGIGNVMSMLDGLSPAALKTTAIIMGVVGAVLLLVGVIAILCGKGEEMNNTFNNMSNTMSGIQSSVSTPRIPQYAQGTSFHPGGFALVGERGPEIVDLPRGSRVYPNGKYPSSGGDVYNVTIDAKNVKEFTDIVNLAKGARQARRAR